MPDPLRQPAAPPQPGWVRLCQWLWKQRGLVWGTIILGIALSLFATWLVSPWGTTYSNTPLGSILRHPLPWTLVGLGLLILTGGLWLINRRYPAPATQEIFSHKNRKIMLDWVTAKWITDFLENPLYYDEQLLSLPLRERVGSRYDLKLYDPLEPAHSLPPDTKILDVFLSQEAGDQLLILGEPGAGKTTLLLELARDLLQRARDRKETSLPVVLTLSSWATKQLPLEQWVIEELKTKYQVPSEIGQAWVANNQLLLLLDGLDEVAPHAQPACIRAVNSYMRQAHRSLVVSSRTKEYLEQPERLAIRTVVAIQPLSPQQVDTYLDSLALAGEEIEGLQRALQQSEPLRTLATTPLLLKVLILAYHGKSAQDLVPLVNTAPTGQLHRLFHDYVERMLQREGPRMHATGEDTKPWLAWLADHLTEHHQSEFYLELTQPDWLPQRQRTFYQRCLELLVGLYLVLFFGLIFGSILGPLAGLGFGLGLGLPIWLYSRLGEYRTIEPADTFIWSRKDLGSGLRVLGVFGLVFGLVPGLVFGLVGGPRVGLGLGLSLWLSFTLLPWLAFGKKQLAERSRFSPNEGIRRSTKNGLLVGLFAWLVLGLVLGLFFAPRIGLLSGLVIGLYFGLISGLGTTIQHYTLRFWLWQAHTFPWKAVPLLDDAADQLLLRKIGGGYVFRHPLLQEYFASSMSPISTEARSGVQMAPNGDSSA